MSSRLIIEGNAVYEIDEDCLECRERERTGRKTGGTRRERETEKKEKKER